MCDIKIDLVNRLAKALNSYGYKVYISKNKQYGFYTDGQRVVCFGGQWRFCVDFSGNYISKNSGTGWQIAAEKGVITKEEAAAYIAANAPAWATRENVIYSTPEMHLKTYGHSSGYTLFN